MSLPENKKPITQLEEGEFVVDLNKNSLNTFLQEKIKNHGDTCFVGLYGMLMGLGLPGAGGV